MVPLSEARIRLEEAEPAEFSDEALALEHAARLKNVARYVDDWGAWYRFTGCNWEQDRLLWAIEQVRETCRLANERTVGRKGAARIRAELASAKTNRGVLHLVRADPRLAATSKQWDVNGDLLNTPDGTVDLLTGEMRPPNPSDYCTKSTAVSPAAPGTPAPIWEAFLRRVADENVELVSYLRRVCGYCLTGSTKEHVLLFFHGTGRNGKGVFINTISRLLGDYATVSSMDTFTASKTEQHPTALASLRGARLVTAQETDEGRRLAEALIKSVTGGDPITARYMRQDFFTFTPTFKLWLAGNHKPALRGVDEAMRARLHLVPFTVTIPASERDPDLPEKLKAEWPAILRWMVDGCLEWRRSGLLVPAAVKHATDDYLAAEDSFGLWLEECCQLSVMGRENTADLFASWKRWAERAGELVGSMKRFAQTLQSRGYEPSRDSRSGRSGFASILLKQPDLGSGR